MKAWLFLVLVLIVLSCEAGKKKKKGKKPSSGSSLKNLFLRRKPTPAPPTTSVNKVPKGIDFRSINSTDKFYEVFKVPRLPQHTKLLGSRPPGGKDHATSVDLSDTSWHCHLSRTLVHLPTPVFGDGLYFPACAWLNRCTGCCFSANNLQACKPFGVEMKEVFYYHIRDGVRPVEKSIWMEEHTACACQCAQSPDSCDPVKQMFSYNTCQCECKLKYHEHNMKCGGKFKYDKTKCGCICATAEKDCRAINHKMIWDAEECGCVCEKDREGRDCRPAYYRDPDSCECVKGL